MFLAFFSSKILLYVGLWSLTLAVLLFSGDYLWLLSKKLIADMAVFFKTIMINTCQFIQRRVVAS